MQHRPRSFDVDLAALNAAFKQLLTKLHPDKFSRRTPTEQRFSEQQSMLVNRAVATLRDPYARGMYLLKLLAHAKADEPEPRQDAAFLSDVMEANEALDAATSQQEVDALRQRFQCTYGCAAPHRAALIGTHARA